MAGRFEPKELERNAMSSSCTTPKARRPKLRLSTVRSQLNADQNLQIGGYSSVTHLPFFTLNGIAAE